MTVDYVHQQTKINHYFLEKLKGIITLESKLEVNNQSEDLLKQAKIMGFSDSQIARLWNKTTDEIYETRQEHGLFPVFKMVDTCAAEFESTTPYFDSTYEKENVVEISDRKKILVLGSGPIRIGQGIEFDD